jgi:hypothetical protein
MINPAEALNVMPVALVVKLEDELKTFKDVLLAYAS